MRRLIKREEQAVHDVRAFHHISHEQEQWDRNQRIVLHHRIGILVQKIENIVVKDICNRFRRTCVICIISKCHAHGDQCEGNRKPEQNQQNEKA